MVDQTCLTYGEEEEEFTRRNNKGIIEGKMALVSFLPSETRFSFYAYPLDQRQAPRKRLMVYLNTWSRRGVVSSFYATHKS